MTLWHLQVYIVALSGSAILAATMAVYSWRRRRIRGAVPLCLLMLAIVVWSLGYALELSSPALPMSIFWAKTQYFGIVGVALLFLIMILQYTGREHRLTRSRLAMLLVVPISSLALVWTNEHHGLIWQQVGLVQGSAVPVLYLRHGPFFWVLIVYSYLVLLAASVLLVRMLVRSSYLYRAQLRILLLGASVPWIGNALYVMDLSPFPFLDLTPFMFVFTGIAAFWGLFRHQLLDVVPVARDVVIDGIEDGVIVLDEQGRIIDINPAARQFLGVSGRRVIGQAIENIDAVWCEVRAELQRGQKSSLELAIGHGDAMRYIDVSISPLRSQRRRLQGYTLILYDITVRKRSEQAFRESEERYGRLVELSPEAIFVHSGGRFIYGNSAGLQLFGASSIDELKEKDWFDLVDPADRPMAMQQVQQLRQQQDRVPLSEYRLRRLDGRAFDAEVTATSINYQDQPAILVIIRDISARRQSEEALRQSMSELELRNAELNAFAHTVAHDLKNPLATFINFVQLMRLDVDKGIATEQLRQYVQVLDRNGKKMHNIINELLLLASVRNERDVDVMVRPLDMQQIANEAVGRLSFMIDTYQASIKIAEHWPTALGYGPWIEEVWVNYLSNALKYGGKPPRVEIGADLVDDGMVCCWVRDNGSGLTPEEQERVFIPFERLHQVRAEGHGLGLSIVQRIVEKLGGQVGVESAPQQGSRFFFLLPAAYTVISPHTELMQERAL